MKQTQDLSMEEFDLFSRCVEAAAKIALNKDYGSTISRFQVNRVNRTLDFRFEKTTTYEPEVNNWAFDSKEGLVGPGATRFRAYKTFYVLYKLLILYFLDDESLLNEMWDWDAADWWHYSKRNKTDRRYKIKATFLGAELGNLSSAYLYKVKWETQSRELHPDFTRVLYQKERISLTRYSIMYRLLNENIYLSPGKAMGILHKIDDKINKYVDHRIFR